MAHAHGRERTEMGAPGARLAARGRNFSGRALRRRVAAAVARVQHCFGVQKHPPRNSDVTPDSDCYSPSILERAGLVLI